jgi:hypothetical protein
MLQTINFTTRQKFFIATAMFSCIVIGRIAPHFWNATPVIGATLFAGVYLGKKYSLLIPIGAMLLSDVFVGFYDVKLMAVVYGSFALVALYSLYLRQKVTTKNVIFSSLGSSLLFFLTTNWAVWQFSAWYPKTFTGLLQSYAMGVPFFRNALLGDLMYTGMFFGAYAVSVYWYQKRHRVVSAAVRYY